MNQQGWQAEHQFRGSGPSRFPEQATQNIRNGLQRVLIGAGRMEQAHADVLPGVKDLRVTWVMDVNAQRGARAATRPGAEPV